MRKRLFDVVVIVLAAVAWVPVVAVAALAVLVFSGRPIFYRSRRWVGPKAAIEMVKLRVMVPHANKVLESVDAGRFLNTPPDSPLYTGVGRILDRLGINEIPQFVHVLRGEMTIVGPRPLTDAVRDALLEEHGQIDERWDSTPAGLTGLPQLVGRIALTDQQRLDLESAYARMVADGYSIRTDFKILLFTVLITFGVKKPLAPEAALDMVRGRRTRVRTLRTARAHGYTAAATADTDAVA
ncbi:sugar transferase [Nocardioides caeni]|uniref:sugar transferase n=1 Tax=Nocardioides caeni TaxID=574700 RepID=UPI00130525AD|nr:sugar transferase [Nocardioides caeni]